jgi:hypothetical protein
MLYKYMHNHLDFETTAVWNYIRENKMLKSYFMHK